MSQKTFGVIFLPENQSKDRELIYVKLYTHVPELFVEAVEEAGFFVDAGAANGLLELKPFGFIDRYTHALAAVECISLWHQQFCGYSRTYSYSKLHIMTNVPQIGERNFEPPRPDAPLRRIGALRLQLASAVKVNNFAEAARLRDEINELRQSMVRTR